MDGWMDLVFEEDKYKLQYSEASGNFFCKKTSACMVTKVSFVCYKSELRFHLNRARMGSLMN